MLNRLDKILLKYSWGLLILALSLNMLAYYGTRAILEPTKYYDFSTDLDHSLPFLKIFIIPYVVAYVQWISGYILIARAGQAHCYYYMTGEIIAKTMCLMFFVFLPTMVTYRPELDSPELAGNDIFSILTRYIFDRDEPNNLFPSIHCLESYVVSRSATVNKKLPISVKVIMWVFSILVFMSTVLLKQHFIVDFFGAVAVVEIGLFVSRHIPCIKKGLSRG